MPAPDHRLLHLQAEALTSWPEATVVSSSARPSTQPFDRSVELLDRPRCAERAARMKASHALVAEDLTTARLDLTLLERWQRTACPEARRRTEAWAFAKGGAERYSLDDDELERRISGLSSLNALSGCLRLYLDLLFFHPFSDGNSRIARLAFHFLSARSGLKFRAVDPLFRLSLPAGDVRAYRLFGRLAVRLLAGEQPPRS